MAAGEKSVMHKNMVATSMRAPIAVLLLLGCAMTCWADVITDWDARASAMASPAAIGQRELAIVDIAMFDAVNSIERRYRPYLVQLQVVEPISSEAAAASAAATALAALHPKS